MTIVGVVTTRREAILSVSVLGADERRTDIEAVMDTGFTGDLTLPDRVIEELSLPSRGVREVVLADGSTVAMEIYRARVVWDGAVRVKSVDVVYLG